MARSERRTWLWYYLRVAVVLVPLSLIGGIALGLIIAYLHVAGIAIVGALLVVIGIAWQRLQRSVYQPLDARFLHKPDRVRAA